MCKLILGYRQGGILKLVNKLPDGLAAAYHTHLCLVIGIILITQQGGLLVAQVNDLAYYLCVVKLILEGTAVIGAVHLFTQVTAVTELDESAVTGIGEVKEPAFCILLSGSLSSHVTYVSGQTCQIRFLGKDHGEGVGGCQQITAILQRKQ